MRRLIATITIAVVTTFANVLPTQAATSYTTLADCSQASGYVICESNAGLVKVSAMDSRNNARITSGSVKNVRYTTYTLTTDTGAKFDVQIKAL